MGRDNTGSSTSSVFDRLGPKEGEKMTANERTIAPAKSRKKSPAPKLLLRSGPKEEDMKQSDCISFEELGMQMKIGNWDEEDVAPIDSSKSSYY